MENQVVHGRLTLSWTWRPLIRHGAANEIRLQSDCVRVGDGRGSCLRGRRAECPTTSCRSLGCRQRRHHRTFGGCDQLGTHRPYLFGSDFTSRGGQTLAANAQSTLGLSGGVNIFPVSRFGLQVLVERASYDLSAANTPYVIALQYISRPPPSGEAQQTTLNQSNAWPDTSGSLTEWAVAFNAAARVGRPDRVGLILSAGPTLPPERRCAAAGFYDVLARWPLGALPGRLSTLGVI